MTLLRAFFRLRSRLAAAFVLLFSVTLAIASSCFLNTAALAADTNRSSASSEDSLDEVEIPPVAADESLGEAEVMDGVPVDAIETYVNPKSHNLTLGLSLYPFNAYYNAFGINPSYTYQLSDTWSWEVLNLGYYFTVDKGLTLELADRFGVNPDAIDRLKYTFTTHILYNLAYGKVVLFKKNIRYFRTSFLMGGGSATTNSATSIGPSVGARLDFYLSDSFSWRFEVRDLITVSSGKNNFVTFTLGTGVSF